MLMRQAYSGREGKTVITTKQYFKLEGGLGGGGEGGGSGSDKRASRVVAVLAEMAHRLLV